VTVSLTFICLRVIKSNYGVTKNNFAKNGSQEALV
jgi:hypothetical protein